MSDNKISAFTKVRIFGIVITIMILGIFGPKIISVPLSQTAKALVNWYDDPTGFFFTYMSGYIVIWKNRFVGSMLIIAGDLLFYLSNPDNYKFAFIFLLPTLAVAALHLLTSPSKTKS